MFDATYILSSLPSTQVRFYHGLVPVLVPFRSNRMLVVEVLLAVVVARKEPPVVEGAVAVAFHTAVVGQEVVDVALGVVHTLEEADLVEGGAVEVPVPSRQSKLTVHSSHLGPREVPSASGAEEVGSKPVVQVVREQPVPIV
jgi:hypothetical protein